MDAQRIDSEATVMEMNANNVFFYNLLGRQTARIDMLEAALTAKEMACQELLAHVDDLKGKVSELEQAKVE